MSGLNNFISQKLQKRKDDNSFRKLTSSSNLIDFTSNDYLGLARSEELHNLIKEKTEKLPHSNGATGSRLLSGNSLYTEKVEEQLARIFNAEACLIFNSGYTANQAVLSSLPQKGDTILCDELVHACIRDGSRLSFANRHSFFHNDLEDLEAKLKKATGNIYIALESIYSMDGDLSPLARMVPLAEKYDASIILDEAHSTGVLGDKGSGLAVSIGLENKIPVRIYTFGKAMGIHGACVAGSRDLIDYLINFARPFIFTTALSPHNLASIDCAFQFLSENIKLQKILKDKIALFRSACKVRSVPILGSESQVQALIIPGNDAVKKASVFLGNNGFDVRPVLSPTVAKKSERLRICMHTFNTNEEITQLADHLSKL